MDIMNFWNDLPQPFFILAPMEDVTDVVFRHVIKKAGAPDVFFTEFTNATGWVHAGQKATGGRLIKSDDEHPLVAQIWGGEPGDMEKLATHCRDLGFHGIDINMGCPAKSAVRSGGSALICKPDIAIAAITAAKTAGLPVSVKTRLGYTRVDEWRDWLTTLLQQDIVNLTIHLRTKKEMSKVPAHFELIDDIIALRNEVAPNTLITINGDIRDRAHGEEIISAHPGIDGIMVGRGVFQNPFCFIPKPDKSVDSIVNATLPRGGCEIDPLGDFSRTLEESAISTLEKSILREEHVAEQDEKQALLDLLHYHLDLFDTWQPQIKRPYETLKRFFKIYIRNFDGASDLRAALMLTHTTDEARAVIASPLATTTTP